MTAPQVIAAVIGAGGIVVVAYCFAEAFGLWDEEREEWERQRRHESITRDVQEFRRAEWKRATEREP